MKVETTGVDLSYVPNGLQLPYGATTLSVTLNDYMKSGSIISLTLYVSSAAGTQRGLDIYSSDGENKIATLATTESGTNTFRYTVESNDKLDGTTGFQLIKTNSNLVYLKSLTVTDCQPGGTISASGWNTYSSNKKLDLNTLEASSGEITAYYAASTGVGTVTMKPATGIVDASEGLMIKGTVGATFTVNATGEAVTFNEYNLLEGLPNGGTVEKDAHNYVFAWETANPTTTYGFYLINNVEPTLGLGKAYLSLDEDIPAEARLNIVFDEEEGGTTAITDVRGKKDGVWGDFYDLSGRKVAQPSKGLYIVNGKKVVVK